MITLRPATMDDAERLLEWRNDPQTRAMSISSDPVELSVHMGWLERRLSRPDPGLYIAEQDGVVPVGTVRIDNDEISYTVALGHRERGVATAMLKVAHELFGPKVAKIKPSNLGSIRAAEKAGHRVEFI